MYLLPKIHKRLHNVPGSPVIVVTADVVGLYPSIPPDESLEVLRKQFNAVKMAEFFLKNNQFELVQLLNIKFRERLLELDLLHRMHVSLWIALKENFSKANEFSPGFGFDDIFFIWTAAEEELQKP